MRSLEYQVAGTTRYTAAAVAERLRAGEGKTDVRFEILDLNHQVVGECQTVRRESGSAVVAMNRDQPIIGSLDLTMLPDEQLRGQFLQRLIRPQWSIRMRDGGYAEFPMGVYPWTIPERELDIELWKITLGDQSHFLDLGGPDQAGLSTRSGVVITDFICWILGLSGISDWTGVVPSTARFTEPKTWVYLIPDPHLYEVRAEVERQLADPTVTDPAHRAALNVWEAALVNVAPKAETNQLTWLRILADLHLGIGYQAPWFDLNGRYRAIPGPVLFGAPVYDWTYETGEWSMLGEQASSTHAIETLANRIFARSNNSSGFYGMETIDADVYIPGHPMSRGKLGRYVNKTIDVPNASSAEALRQAGALELLRCISVYEKVTIRTLAHPGHEAFDAVGLRWDGDAEFDTVQAFDDRAWSFDLFGSQTGDMVHNLQHLHVPA